MEVPAARRTYLGGGVAEGRDEDLPQVGLLRRVVERLQVDAVLGVVLVGVA